MNSDGSSLEASFRAHFQQAQLDSYARRTPINTAVLAVNALAVAAMLWPAAPRQGVVAWVVVQLAIAGFIYGRWRLGLTRPRRPPGPYAIPRAILYATMAGLGWGTLAGFLGFLSDPVQILIVLVAAAMIAGAATTLGAIPQAVIGFTLATALPFTGWFLLGGNPAHQTLGIMSIVFALAMIGLSRTVHSSVEETAHARVENARLLERFEAARQDWLEVAEATDGYALFDVYDRLLMWNGNYATFLSLPADALMVGVPRSHLAKLCSAVVERQTWDDDETPALSARVTQLANGRWLRSWARRTARGNLVELHTDVSALKDAERRLLEQEGELQKSRRLEAIGLLAGGVAHDFNNLLTVIQGHAAILEQALASQPELGTNAAATLEAAHRGAALVRQLLAFSQTQELVTASIDLARLLRNLEGMVHQLIRPGIALTIRTPPGPIWIRADAQQIERVVVNLCRNASDAMPDGGVLTITLWEMEHGGRTWAALEVRDTGTGMPPEVRDHLFEPFFTTKPEGEGTGLGLATAYGIIRQSEGSIEVDTAPGRGSSFRVMIPRAVPLANPRVRTTPVPQPSMEGRTLVVVEDEPRVLAVTSLILRKGGFRVLGASSPSEALQLCREYPGAIDLMVSDVIMPEMHGPELADRAAEIRPGIPVLFVSGYTHGALVERGEMHVEPGQLLPKPFTPDELLEAVATRLRMRAAAQEG